MQDAWHIGPGVDSIKMMIGHARAGICRRMQGTEEEWFRVAQQVLNARRHCGTIAGFGVGFLLENLKLGCSDWTPSSMWHLQQTLSEVRKRKNLQISDHLNPSKEEMAQVFMQRASSKNGRQNRCHFGHTTTSAMRGTNEIWHANPPVSFWFGVRGGVVLCNKCYQSGYRAQRK